MTKNKTIVIKKYPNRRLYNTETSKYITLSDLSELVKKEQDFKVVDVKTQEDVTRIVLTQIILEHEMQGYNLLPMQFLKQIIKFYDHPLNQVFSNFMGAALGQFNQGFDQYKNMVGDVKIPTTPEEWQEYFTEINKQNNKILNNLFEKFSNIKKDT